MKNYDWFEDFWLQTEEFSNNTFGPPSHRGPIGPLDHLEKEIQETLDNPTDIKEYVDCFFLIIDATRRAGFNIIEFEQACWEKLEENKARNWPDWRNSDPNKTIEHDRSDE